jgi:site-specific recombinase XerD
MVLIHNNTKHSKPSKISGARVKSQGFKGNNYFALFLKSREAMGVSDRTLQFYKERLSKIVVNSDYINITREQLHDILNSIPPNKYGLATRHASYRALKTFYRWLHYEFGITNPMEGLPAPILGKPILPTSTLVQVRELLEKSPNLRAKAIIALFVESGLRLTELSNLRLCDLDWESHTIRVMGKGRKEAEAPFGPLTEQYLRGWLQQNRGKADTNGNIWGITSYGIVSMLRRLEKTTGITCNPHVFRRTFAVLLRQAGVDTMTIQNLGRWENIEMVQRYTRSFTFRDSLRFYKPPLGGISHEYQA